MSLDLDLGLGIDLDSLLSLVKTAAKTKEKKKKERKTNQGWVVAVQTKGSGYELWLNTEFPTKGGRRLFSELGLMTEAYINQIGPEEAIKRKCIFLKEEHKEELEMAYAASPAGKEHSFLTSAEIAADGTLQDYLADLTEEQKMTLATKVAKMWAKAHKHGFCGNRFAEWIAAIMKKSVTRPHIIFCSDLLGWIERTYSNAEFNSACDLPEVFPRASFTIPRKNESYRPSLGWVEEIMKPHV